MLLKDFDYHLPEELIAQTPLMHRDQARLLVVHRKKKEIIHDHFYNIGRYLPANSILVLNNSRVIPARLLGKKERSGGGVEIFLLKKLIDGYTYEVLLRPANRIKDGDKIFFAGSDITAMIVDKEKKLVRFNQNRILQNLDKIGNMPLPPYIRRPVEEQDKIFYQTVYARYNGSVAAPTAGLHFTKPLLDTLQKEGHDVFQVTLHINYATFKLVESQDITQHKMHHEEYSISKRVSDSLRRAKAEKRKIMAVGTTSCRVLETNARSEIQKGTSNLFIYPGFDFRMIDGLITNFHLPLSTLLMLVHAFGTPSLIKQAYQEAIEKKYRFFSYGDAMIII